MVFVPQILHLYQENNVIFRRYHIDMTSSHTAVTTVAL